MYAAYNSTLPHFQLFWLNLLLLGMGKGDMKRGKCYEK